MLLNLYYITCFSIAYLYLSLFDNMTRKRFRSGTIKVRDEDNIWQKRMLKANAFAASAHIASTAIMLVMGVIGPALSVDVYALSPSFNKQRFLLYLQWLGDFEVFWLSVAFVFLAAMDHLYQLINTTKYIVRVDACCNWHRWLEYSLSAPIMHVHIALLSGVTDLFLLIAIFFLMHWCIVIGWVSDYLYANSKDDKKWIAEWLFWFGCLPYIVQGAFILTFFSRTTHNSTAPDFVYAIIVVISVLDVMFAVVQYMYMFVWSRDAVQKRVVAAYRKGEFYFQLLSLTSKLSLAYIAFFGSRDMGN